ncbi:rhomboid family intramembrane serine protease [candidate division KSB1 bacterium]|nr:rhomboid family intramembrane serine protease [candidate division KSB1 bacterium]RQW11016.1 MAG: rhomboid family intramembrane serine protease [candidate division KSB1 bacterium]
MIPIRDDNPRRLLPIVTIVTIAINVAVFIYQLTLSQDDQLKFLYNFGAVPNLIVHGQNLYTILSSMFMHGGLMHLAGNMLYLWIFGDNVEGICGHGRFVIFYLLCGLIAFLSHFIFDPVSQFPMVGASGAISGIMGAYILRFPRARVHVVVPLLPFIWLWRRLDLPAFVVLGFWLLLQIFNAFFSTAGSGVAWFAHVGGFAAGVLLIRLFEKKNYRVYY